MDGTATAANRHRHLRGDRRHIPGRCHNEWSSLPAAIISAIGWLLVVEGVVDVVASERFVGDIVATFNTPRWYAIGGVLAGGLGAYLAGYGFGWW